MSPGFNSPGRIWLIMKAGRFSIIHCRNRAALIQKAAMLFATRWIAPRKLSLRHTNHDLIRRNAIFLDFSALFD